SASSLQMWDHLEQPSSVGAGWSALDVGRLLVWLRILEERHPHFSAEVEDVLERWNWDRLVHNGELQGTHRRGHGPELTWQEGRLGYEHYAAAGLALHERLVPGSLDFDQVQEKVILGRTLTYDQRHHAFLTAEPFILGALEIGLRDPRLREAGDRLYRVQKRRFEVHGLPTALTE